MLIESSCADNCGNSVKLSKLIISNPHAFDIRNQPVAIGVPLPAGVVERPGDLGLSDRFNQAIDHAMSILSRWPDGSARWILIETLVSVKAEQQITLHMQLAADERLRQDNKGSDTAAVEHSADSAVFQFKSDGICFRLEPGSGQVLAMAVQESTGERAIAVSRLELVDVHGTRHSLPVIDQRWTRCDSGYSAVLETVCEFRHQAAALAIRVTVKQKCYANSALSRLEICLYNPNAALHPGGIWDLGDPGSLRFKALSLVMQGPANATVKWQENSGVNWRESNHEPLSIVQASSGGEHWDSPVHVDANSEQTLPFRGYRVKQDSVDVAAGNRCDPAVMMDSGNFQMTIRPEKFWQCFPKGLQANAQECRLHMFPELDCIEHELQGGESSTFVSYLGFGSTAETLSWVNHPLQVSLEPDSVFRSHVLQDWQDENTDSRYSALLHPGLEGEQSFFCKREKVDEYGWRHFGDLHADHETWQQAYEGIFVSHYNNQYDPLFGFARRYLQTGDPRYYELMSDLACHVLDIDLYRTDEDRPEYNRGLFWHTDHYVQAHTATHRSYSQKQQSANHNLTGGGPGGQHCYTSGLCLYYLLTGDVRARQAVFDLTQWIGCVYEGSGSIVERARASVVSDLPAFLKLLKRQKVWRYRLPLDRGVGYYIRALLDCYELDGHCTHLARIGSIIRATVGPMDDVDGRGLDDIEKSWFYTVFFQAVVAFLDTKRELDTLDADFHYARSALLRYTDWMLIHETPYLDSRDKLEFANDTWVAQDTRKAALLHAAYRYSQGNRESLLARALYFKNYVIETLSDSDTLYYTRIQAILLQNHGPVGNEWSEQAPYTLGTIPQQCDQKGYSSTWSYTRKFAGEWWCCLRDFSISREIAWLRYRFPKVVSGQ